MFHLLAVFRIRVYPIMPDIQNKIFSVSYKGRLVYEASRVSYKGPMKWMSVIRNQPCSNVNFVSPHLTGTGYSFSVRWGIRVRSLFEL